MRPCDKCGKPIHNSKTHCGLCGAEPSTSTLEPTSNDDKPILVQNERFTFVDFTLLMRTIFEFVVGGIFLGAMIGATAFGVSFGILSFSFSASVTIAILTGCISGAKFIYGHLAA